MNREAIKAALFTLLSSAQFDLGAGAVSFTTASPKLLHWNDVAASAQPAFFLSQGPQTPLPPPAPGGPRAWHLDYWARIYVNTQGQTDPATVLNPILDSIEAKFILASGVAQNLGGLVEWVRIEGMIETFGADASTRATCSTCCRPGRPASSRPRRPASTCS
jgi:hypothetical protein